MAQNRYDNSVLLVQKLYEACSNTHISILYQLTFVSPIFFHLIFSQFAKNRLYSQLPYSTQPENTDICYKGCQLSEIEVLILWPADFDVIGGDLGKQIAVFITE